MRCNNNNNSHRNFKSTSASLIRVTRHSGPLPCWQRRGSSAICLFVHAVAHHCWPEGRVPATRLRDMTLHTQQYTTQSGTVWTCLRKYVHTIGWPGLISVTARMSIEPKGRARHGGEPSTDAPSDASVKILFVSYQQQQ